MLCTSFRAVFLMAFAATGVWAQATAPTPANGETRPLALRSQPKQTNLLIGSIRVSTALDDNAFSTNANRVSDFSYQVRPSIAFEQSRRRLRWSLSYSPSLSLHQRLAERDVLGHALGINFEYRATRRLTVRFRDAFHITTDPFDRLDQDLFMPEFSVLDRPNESVVTPLAKRIGNLAGLDLTYQLGPRSTVGVGGTFSDVRFRDLPGNEARADRLIDTRSAGGRAFYSRHVSPRHFVGAMYQFQSLTFRGGDARTVTHGLLYFHTIELTPHTTLSFFAGPEYLRTHDQVVMSLGLLFPVAHFTFATLETGWSITGGSTFNWQGERTGFRTSIVRRVSDGGGLLGGVRFHEATAELRRRLTRHWTADFRVGYADSRVLDISPTPGAQIRDLAGSVGFTRSLGEHLTLDLRYGRVHQSARGELVGNRISDHNRFSASLAYHFSRPLGR